MRDIFTLTKPRPVVWRNYSETKTHSYSIPFSFCGMKISKKNPFFFFLFSLPPVAPTTDGASLHFLYALYTKAVHTACSGNFLAPSPIPSNWDMIGWAVGGGGQLGGQSTPVCSCARLVFFFFFFPSRRNNVIWFWTDCWLFTLLSSLHTFLHLLHNTMWHCINCLRAWCHVLSCSLVTKHLEYWGKNEKHLSKKKLILVSENSAQMTAHSRCQHDVN